MAEIKVKYPRVIVSQNRHAALSKEATKRGNGTTIEQVAEEKFATADKATKRAPYEKLDK